MEGCYSNPQEPVVSVIMGVYGQDVIVPRLTDSVGSVLNQSLSSLELLISDDGSSAGVLRCLDKLASSDARVRLLREPCGTALPEKLNLCLRYARGGFIARQDDDDLSLPCRLERQLEFLRAHPEIAFVGSNVILEKDGLEGGVRSFPPRPEVEDFLFRQPYCHPTLLFRREIMEPYSESPRCLLCEDYDLLLRLYEKGCTGANLQTPVFRYHVSDSDVYKRRMRHRVNESITRWRHFRALGLLPKALPFVCKPIAVGLLPRALLQWIHRRG